MNTIQVDFLGEQGIGLTREFYRLVGYHASLKYFESTGCFKHNLIAFQVCMQPLGSCMHVHVYYFKLGQLIAMALLQGGLSVRLLSQSVYNYLCGMKPHDIIVDIKEIPDATIRAILDKVSEFSECYLYTNLYRYCLQIPKMNFALCFLIILNLWFYKTCNKTYYG